MSPTADRKVNVLDETQLNDAFEQFEPSTVIHCAGVVKFRRADAETLQRVNVQGTRNVLSSISCRKTKTSSVRHLVYLSSVAVLGARREGDDDDERGPLLTEEDFSVGRTFERNPYAQSKQDAHELVLQFRKDNHPNNVCVDRVAGIFNRTESKQRVLGKENDTFARSIRDGFVGRRSRRRESNRDDYCTTDDECGAEERRWVTNHKYGVRGHWV